MTQEPRVFIDMDGVLADFIGGLHAYFGEPYKHNEYPYASGEWLQLPQGKIPHTWALRVDSKFWRGLDTIAGATQLVRLCKRLFGKENVFIASNCTGQPSCFAGKMQWLHDHRFCRGLWPVLVADKASWIPSNCLMIDDGEANIETYRVRGGTGILVPRPWNSRVAFTNINTRGKLFIPDVTFREVIEYAHRQGL